MRCLIDEALPRSIARALRESGIEADDARDVGLRSRPDQEIFDHAVRNRQVLVTADTDFSDIRRFPPASHFGIGVARFPDKVTQKTLVSGILDALKAIREEDLARTLMILRPGSVRFRKG